MPAATPIVIEVDGQHIVGQLDATATAASLIAQLPLTLSFRDFGGQEKIARLPEALDLTGAPSESGAEPLTIAYYAPEQSIVLYYDQVGSYPGIVPIGSYADTDVVETRSGEFGITIREAD